ncbi:hypothetical protein PN466_16465 [Roseofilum reptotaenium CS-1145]|uniref:SGNH hydrolase-type esterase domain-containing protein n=1 Tax=Roseofilum reptotaenium AO1-A TaxID=1925591 RepID=A0A1L9QWT0_9CYAN|nr:hypothetical protein [Roseofilum reptotaenium]MDB9518540.1 hypothetical protein [Roseofilum reptotaenium CS-1145]OJJ27057.1 hypothetical protein BI308_03110 [Roseofilum reptotaenium AO1-A]
MARNKAKENVYSVILFLLLYGVTEAIASAGLYYLGEKRNVFYQPADTLSEKHQEKITELIEGKTQYYQWSSTLGWTIQPNGSSRLFQANSAGFRGDRNYPLKPPDNILRITSFGDSFTHGAEVKNHETWQATMEKSSGYEVLNFGVGAFGLDQAYLRYQKDGKQYESQVVLIGFMVENIYRHINTFRPFYFPQTGFPLGKPRFILEGGELLEIPNALPTQAHYQKLLQRPQSVLAEVGAHDRYYNRRYKSSLIDWSPTVRLVRILIQEFSDGDRQTWVSLNQIYHPESEAFQVTTAIFDRFYQEVQDNGSIPIIIIFPRWHDVQDYRTTDNRSYQPLLDRFAAQGYRYIDLMDLFADEELDLSKIFLTEYGHNSALGNQMIAERILDYLKDLQEAETLELSLNRSPRPSIPLG